MQASLCLSKFVHICQLILDQYDSAKIDRFNDNLFYINEWLAIQVKQPAQRPARSETSTEPDFSGLFLA